MSKKSDHWSGVFPAVSTQFRHDYPRFDATHAGDENLSETVSPGWCAARQGKHTSLTTEEKLQIIEVAKRCGGRQNSGDRRGRRVHYRVRAEDGERGRTRWRRRDYGDAGAGLLLEAAPKPPLHFRVPPPPTCRLWFITTRRFTRTTSRRDILATLTDCDNIVCFKDSSGDTVVSSICVTPSATASVLFAGLDDVVVESIAVGAEGWISGMS